MLTFLILAVGSLSGCAASPTEKAWQALHVIDVAQTINGPARDDCYREAHWPKYVIGDKPSTEAVIAWGVVIGVAHYAFDRWLTETGRADHPAWRALRVLDLTYKGYTVGNNHHIGVRPWGANQCPHR